MSAAARTVRRALSASKGFESRAERTHDELVDALAASTHLKRHFTSRRADLP